MKSEFSKFSLFIFVVFWITCVVFCLFSFVLCQFSFICSFSISDLFQMFPDAKVPIVPMRIAVMNPTALLFLFVFFGLFANFVASFVGGLEHIGFNSFRLFIQFEIAILILKFFLSLFISQVFLSVVSLQKFFLVLLLQVVLFPVLLLLLFPVYEVLQYLS